jgi:hypothetical protein
MIKKETITKNTIANEVCKGCCIDILQVSLRTLTYVLFLNLTTFVLNKLSVDFLTYIFIALYLFVILFSLLTIVNLVKIVISAKKGKFDVLKDAIASKDEICDRYGIYNFKTHIWALYRSRYHLNFFEHGEYAYRVGDNYLTSEMWRLDEKILFERYSDIDEEFYLIIFDKKRAPFVVYNTRLFEFIDDFKD